MISTEHCPYCNALLNNFTAAGAEKHIRRCSTRKNVYHHTGGDRGRPRVHQRIVSPKKPL